MYYSNEMNCHPEPVLGIIVKKENVNSRKRINFNRNLSINYARLKSCTVREIPLELRVGDRSYYFDLLPLLRIRAASDGYR